MQNKTLLFFFGAFLMFSTVTAQGFKTDDPGKYFEYIRDEQYKISDMFLGFTDLLLSNPTKTAAENERQRIGREMQLSLRKVRNMGPFKGKTTLRDEAIVVMEMYKGLIMGEYGKGSVERSTGSSSIADLEAFFTKQVETEAMINSHTDQMKKVQAEFAAENNMKLAAGEYHEQFERIMAANIYCRNVYLGYLKLAKVNETWWDAFDANDVNGMETARARIEDAIRMSKVRELGALFGNTDLRDAVVARLEFFQRVAQEEYPKMESVIANPMRNQADVEDLNERIDAYNKKQNELSDRFNQTNLEAKQRAVEVVPE